MSNKPQEMGNPEPPESLARLRGLFLPGPPWINVPSWALSQSAPARKEGEPPERLTMLADAWNYEASKLNASTYLAFQASIVRLRKRLRREDEVLALRQDLIDILNRIAWKIDDVAQIHGADVLAADAPPPLEEEATPGELRWIEQPRWQPVAGHGPTWIPDPPHDLPVRGYYLDLGAILKEKEPRTRDYFRVVFNQGLNVVDASQTWGEARSDVSDYLEYEVARRKKMAQTRDLIAFRIALLKSILQEYDLFGFVRRIEYSQADIEEEERRSTTVGIYCEALVTVLGDWRGDMWVAKKDWARGEKGFSTPTDLFNQMGDLIKKKDVRRQIGRWRSQKTPALGGHPWPSTGSPVKEFIRLADAIADRFTPPSDGQDINRTG